MISLKGVISMLTRKRTFVRIIAVFLLIVFLLWKLDVSKAGYLDSAKNSFSISSGRSTLSMSGGRTWSNSSEKFVNSSNLHAGKNDTDSKLIQQEEHIFEVTHLPTNESVEGAMEFVLNRRQAYHDHKAGFSIANQWRLRGHGYLYTYQHVVLAAEVPKHPAKGRNLVKIWNVHGQTASTFNSCHLLTLWVRVNGPEIFAGIPQVAKSEHGQSTCHWEFEFDVQKEGNYEVDAKMLLWNGHAPVVFTGITHDPNGKAVGETNQCPDTLMDQDVPKGIVDDENHNGFFGFKFYSPLSACCEICRRVEGCSYWMTPPTNIEASMPRNGCELYYDKNLVHPEDIPKSHMLAQAGRSQRHRQLDGVPHASGSPASNNTEVAQFLGCGWSFHLSLDFPCLSGDLDDHIFMVNRTFVVKSEAKSTLVLAKESPLNKDDVLPLCGPEHETFRDESQATGRWVREPWPDNNTCPFPREVDGKFKSMFEITAFNGNHPHCWHQDDLSRPRKSCAEANCRLLPQTGKWEASSLHQETEWMGTWRPYECDYYEFSNDQLQQCITQRRIGSIATSGVSIAAMLEQYLQVRMAGMKLAPSPAGDNGSTGETMSVVIDTLRWPHLLWHESEEQWVDMLNRFPNVNSTREEHYWVSSFFVASEREPYVHVARAEKLAKHAQKILSPKGYKMINAFDLTAAFAYDSAGQGDGLHIIGPPMKAILTKIFHHMCSGVIEGTIYNMPDEADKPLSLSQPVPHPVPKLMPQQSLPTSPPISQATEVPQPKGRQLNLQKQPQNKTMMDALSFVLSRKRAYKEHTGELHIGNHWKLRGHGYLYTYQDIVLAAEGPTHPVKMGPNKVSIWNVHEATRHKFQRCHLLTLWVRVSGPEMFAGAPKVVQASPVHSSSCHWEFEFDIQEEGAYDIDVKVLLWNGLAPVHMYQPPVATIREARQVTERSQCPDTVMNQLVSSDDTRALHNGFIGFKLYTSVTACCEICRRTNGCVYWSTPPKGFSAIRETNGCELYYNESLVQHEDIPRSHMLAEAGVSQSQRRLNDDVLHASGSPMSNNTETAYFVGCGWSYHFTLDFPCLSGDLDDQVYTVNPSFKVQGNGMKIAARQRLPLCQLSHEILLKNDSHLSGRWVIENASDTSVCPFPRKRVSRVTTHNGAYPHCWHRDDLSDFQTHCADPNCMLISTTSKWEASKLHQQTDWMGVWRNYDCNYLEFTNQQLQQCLNRKKIASIDTRGASISRMMKKYLNARMANLALQKSGSLSIVVDTLEWPHLLWKNTEEEWIKILDDFPDVDPSKKEHYWVTGFFVTSEREPYIHVSRAQRLVELTSLILTPKGYKMINAFDPSAAFAYDTAGQGDGLHVLGPPMKAILTKVFHHMCAGVVKGSVL